VTDSPVFDFVAQRIERLTDLGETSARDTLHLALKAALFDPRTVDGMQMLTVIERILPGELRVRGVKDSMFVCKTLAIAVKASVHSWSDFQSPEFIFDRLIRR
jgi:hypothetical protein